jgi:hypothetical protein
MFPISKETLSFREISDYWSREITASRNELLNSLIGAWWRGEIVGDAPHRLQFLRNLFVAMQKSKDPRIVFISGDEAGPSTVHELPDGSVEWDYRPHVRVPSSNTDDWDEAACDPAFRSFEEIDWELRCPELLLTFRLFNLSRAAFINWVADRGFYPKPTFWGGDVATTPPPPVTAPPFDKPLKAGPVLSEAPSSVIHQEITAVYDEADAAGAKPPNIKELPDQVLPRLKTKGFRTSKSRIMDLGGDDRHASRRGPVGKRRNA